MPGFSLQNHKEMMPKLLALFLVVAGFSAVTLVIMELVGGAHRLQALVENAGVWAPVVYVLVKISTYVVAPLSGTSVVMASGVLFGVWEGMALSVLGDTIGGSLNYWIARSLGRKGVARFAGKKALKTVDDTANQVGGWPVLLGARVLLSSVYDFISYAAGLARFPFGHFVWVTALGGIPSGLMTAYLGSATAHSARVMHIVIGMAGALFVLFGVLHIVERRRSKKGSAAEEEA